MARKSTAADRSTSPRRTVQEASPDQKASPKTNRSTKSRGKLAQKKPPSPSPAPSTTPAVVLLAGGNPQIAKGDGEEPVQAYLSAMPGWKQALGRQIDALIQQTVPNVKKAVRWNSPFYGIENQGWFLSFHVFSRYVKVTFFRGSSLRPNPPGVTPKSGDARWIDIHEHDFNADSFIRWVKQAAAIPGWGGRQ